MQQFTDVRKSRSWFAHSLALHLQLLPPSPVSLLSKLSFSSVLLAFTLFLWEDNRLFLLRLQSSALQERRDRETSSSFHLSPFFRPFFHWDCGAESCGCDFLVWMLCGCVQRCGEAGERDSGCGAVHQLNVNGWTWRCPEETEVCGGCVCLFLKNASVCEYPEQKVVSEQTGCWCISFRQRCMDAH